MDDSITTVKYLKLASKVRWMRAKITKLEKEISKLKSTAVKAVSVLSVALSLTVQSGCMNIMEHCEGTSYAYCGTVENCYAISLMFDSDTKGEDQILRAYAILLSPIIFIDLPLEVVSDTITFPYDIFNDNREKDRL